MKPRNLEEFVASYHKGYPNALVQKLARAVAEATVNQLIGIHNVDLVINWPHQGKVMFLKNLEERARQWLGTEGK